MKFDGRDHTADAGLILSQLKSDACERVRELVELALLETFRAGQAEAPPPADERQRFIDKAATRFMAVLSDGPALIGDNEAAGRSYNMAETLWEERERRRKGSNG